MDKLMCLIRGHNFKPANYDVQGGFYWVPSGWPAGKNYFEPEVCMTCGKPKREDQSK